ncbi:MAG: response regulator [Alphaproteobacteria bacterium]|jgi:two-component system chemotaxis response regulator CheY|nr:response regulator [Alphaproteobacteria bacterium]MBT4020278.1 response regulator [Alphaproteobacteria bacterium]MBT4965449.1 response regulator [Alphaproteobacteria bacterium]MBT5158468.1 response regulator [Alphaproteobacteria bacterium]
MKSCLVVDDSKVIRMVARRILEGLSFEVIEAVDGKDALDRCLETMPDAVLLDWNMPIMSGIEFLRELRKTDGGDAPVVVFCTTENDMEHIREAMEAGANEYIMKPFDSDILEAKFTQVGLI